MPLPSETLPWMRVLVPRPWYVCLGIMLWVFVLGHGQASWGQQTRLVLHTDSQFWIQGAASSIRFTCKVSRVEGTAELSTAQSRLSSSPGERQTEVVVRVPVRAFDCGNARMTTDLQEALKMEDHPNITFELVHATVGTPLDTSGTWRRIRVLGTLTIAGTKRLVNLEARGHTIDRHRFRVRGCRALRMTHFNIDPPTKAFGLIKVKDRVVVQFDLLAFAPAKTSGAPFEEISVDESPSCSVG